MDSESSQAGSTRRRGSSLVQQIINEERNGIRRASPRRMPSNIPEAPHTESPHSYEEEENNPVSSGSDWEMDDIRSDEGLEDDEETGLTVQDRQKRTRRKRRNTLADARVVPDGDMSKEEERLATESFMRDAIINSILIGLWYTFSISISVVSHALCPCSILDTYLLIVQQMDVLKRQPRLPLPSFHDLCTHARTISPFLARSIFHSQSTTETQTGRLRADCTISRRRYA